MLHCTTTALLAVLSLSAVPDPAGDARILLDSAQKFREMTAAYATAVKVAADESAEHAKATVAAAATAEKARENALAARIQAERDAVAADNFAMLTNKLIDGELATHRSDATRANTRAKAALENVIETYSHIEQAAKTARSRADTCQSHQEDATKKYAAASEALRAADEALATAKIFAKDAWIAQAVNGDKNAAEQSRKKTEVELGKVQTAQETAAALVAPTQGQQQAAAELRRLADADLAEAQRQLQLVQTEARAAGHQAFLARTNFNTASALAGHLHDPNYLAARSDRDAALAAHEQAAGAATRAKDQADLADEKAQESQSIAKTANSRSADAVDAIVRTSEAVREARAAVQASDAAVRKADIEASKFPSNSPQANVAHRAAAAARADRAAAQQAAAAAHVAYNDALQFATGTSAAARDADLQAKNAMASAADARSHAQSAAAARSLAEQAKGKAEQAVTDLLAALRSGANVANSLQAAAGAKATAERQAQNAQSHEADATTHAVAAESYAGLARAASDRASQVAQAEQRAETFKQAAIEQAQAAAINAERAGLTLERQRQLKDAWDNAEVTATQDALLARVKKASESKGNVDVQRAEDGASVAELLAVRAEARSAARIREYEADARTARANKVKSAPSPFYFASAAHFPIPEFGLRGEAIAREGVVIYEDMKLSFDRDGNYEVHFRASTPDMPATIRLQFQIQPCHGGPWYTVTLAPIDFPYPPPKGEKAAKLKSCCGAAGESKNCCGEVHNCVCKGHSEILRRCYAEMGQDARIRRSGSARFGFGVDVP